MPLKFVTNFLFCILLACVWVYERRPDFNYLRFDNESSWQDSIFSSNTESSISLLKNEQERNWLKMLPCRESKIRMKTCIARALLLFDNQYIDPRHVDFDYAKPLPSRLTRTRSISKNVNNIFHTCLHLRPKTGRTNWTDDFRCISLLFFYRKCKQLWKKLFTVFDTDHRPRYFT